MFKRRLALNVYCLDKFTLKSELFLVSKHWTKWGRALASFYWNWEANRFSVLHLYYAENAQS